MPVYPFVLGAGGGSGGGGAAAAGFVDIAAETDVAGYGLARVLEQYQPASRLRGMLSILLDGEATIGLLAGPTGVQSIEDLAWQLYTQRWLHTFGDMQECGGVNLDVIGKILGQGRTSSYLLTDSIYVAWLKARILVNRSDGTITNILSVLVAVGLTEPIAFYEYWPAAIMTECTDVPADPAGLAIWDIAQRAGPCGVRWDFVWSTYSETDCFTISADPAAETTDADRGIETVGGGAGGYIMRSYR